MGLGNYPSRLFMYWELGGGKWCWKKTLLTTACATLNLSKKFSGLLLCNTSRKWLPYWWFWTISATGLFFKAICNKKNIGKCYGPLWSNECHYSWWQKILKDIAILSLDVNWLDYCIFQRLDLLYITTPCCMPREGINKTFLIGGVPTTGLDKHVMKKNLERRGLKRGNLSEIHWENTQS